MIVIPTVTLALYSDVRRLMRPGDGVAFGGKAAFSRAIKFTTRSPFSHFTTIVDPSMVGGTPDPDRLNWITEASDDGVTIKRLSHVLAKYDGEIWWLPLSEESRKKLDLVKFHRFILDQQGKSYDMLQALSLKLGFNHEDIGKFFCSEYVAAAYEAGGMVDNVNASDVTPRDMVRFKLWSNIYQLKGERIPVRGFNTIRPDGWGM